MAMLGNDVNLLPPAVIFKFYLYTVCRLFTLET